MDSVWLLDFITLAKTGNFSRAAEARHVTQPAFSRRIKLLEDWVGASLFDRSSHPAVITEAGREFLPLAEDILNRLERAREKARAAEQDAVSTLRFAVTQVLSLGFFPTWLRSTGIGTRMGPIHLISDSLEACEDALLQGRSQFLLGHYLEGMRFRLPDADYASVIIRDDRLVPVSAIGPDGSALYDMDGGADELPFLGYEQNGLGRVFATAFDEPEMRPALVPVVRSHLALLLGLALEGRGIAWVPETVVRPELERGSLVLAGSDRWRVPMEIRMFRPRRPQSAAAESFWTEIARTARPGPAVGTKG